MSSDLGYSHLSDTAERLFIVDVLFTGGIGLTLSILIFFSLRQKLLAESHEVEKNKYYSLAIKWAMVSVINSMLCFLFQAFLSNDLIIPWRITPNNKNFVAISDSFINITYCFGKLAFYFGFTYHVESVFFINKDKMHKFLKLWMIIVAIAMLMNTITYVIDDAYTWYPDEIGVTQTRNIYVGMYVSHETADLFIYLVFVLFIIDSAYFFVLSYLYISGSKQMQINNNDNSNNLQHDAVKGIVLLFIACIIYWILMICDVFDFEFKYFWGNIDIISDDICLFLMFKGNQQIYNALCGNLCNPCCSKIIYGSKYVSIQHSDESDDDQ